MLLEHADIDYAGADSLVHPLAEHDAGEHAPVTEKGGDEHTLEHDHADDVPRAGTEGTTDAELVCAFLHADEHDVAHAHDATEQREKSQYPESRVDKALGAVHRRIVLGGVPNPHGSVVVGGKVVARTKCAADAVGQFFHLLRCATGAGFERDLIDVDAAGVDAMDGGVGRIELVAAEGKVVLLYADHAKGTAAQFEGTPHCIDTASEELFFRLFVNYHHMAAFAHVDFVEETATNDLNAFHVGVGWEHAEHRGRDVLPPDAGHGRALELGRCRLYLVAVLTEQRRAVVVLEVNLPPLLESVPGLRRPAWPDVDGVEVQSFAVLVEGVDDAVAGSEQYDEQEQAAGHGNARSHHAHLVAHHCVPYLANCVHLCSD